MFIVLVLLLTMAGLAQDSTDASALVREVSDTAVRARTWTVEGSIKYSDSKDVSTFSLAMRSGTQSSFDQIGGGTPSTVVCDGTYAWVLSKPIHLYTKVPVAEYRYCVPIVSDWYQLPNALSSPTLKGEGKFESNGQSKPCQLLQGFSRAQSINERIERTLCIDLNRKMIVWEKAERKSESRTYTYTRLEVNVDIPDSTFVFKPLRATEIEGVHLPVLRPIGVNPVPVEPGVTLPQLGMRKAPELDWESVRRRIDGTVFLYVVINEKGVPSDVRVFRSLATTQDTAAVKAVKQWRFSPATKNGTPIPFGELIGIGFN